MMNSKKEVIKCFLFEGTDEMKREKLEIAWDIWENFGRIKEEKAMDVLKEVYEGINKIIFEPYIVTLWDGQSIYVAKSEWKENAEDRGIYSISIEVRKWFKEERIRIGIVKNKSFKVSYENRIKDILYSKGLIQARDNWWLSYLPLYKHKGERDYYLDVFLNPDGVVDKLITYFEKVYKIITDDKELEGLLDNAVKEKRETDKKNH